MSQTNVIETAPALLADDKVRVFISYAHPDAEIAQALYEALKETNPNRVICFLDTFTITTGDDWARKIENELQISDWLIFIYHEGRSYEFCGFEIGVFRALHGLNVPSGEATSRRLFTIHDIEPLPSLLRSQQNRKVAVWPGDEDLVSGRALSPAETEFYANTPLGNFFAEFASRPAHYPLAPLADPVRDAIKLRERVAKQARDVTVPFRRSRLNDLKSELIYQNRIEIEIAEARFWQTGQIPAEAVISGKESTFLLLGYAGAARDGSVQISWSGLREHYRQNATVVAWLDAVEREIVEAGKSNLPRDEIITFESGYDGQVYRPIVARQEIFQNGRRRFYVQFIKTLKRQFAGEEASSALLAGTVMGSRGFFRLFEQGDLAMREFGPDLDDDELNAACRQLMYDIERMEHESSEFGITNPDVIVKALGEDNRAIVETQYQVWKDAKADLFLKLRQRLAAKDQMPRTAVVEAVRAFGTRIEKHNRKFLVACLSAYQALISKRLNARPQGGPGA